MVDPNAVEDAIIFLIGAMFANWQACVSLLFALLAIGLAFHWWDARDSKARWEHLEREQEAMIRELATRASEDWVAKQSSRHQPLPVRRSYP